MFSKKTLISVVAALAFLVLTLWLKSIGDERRMQQAKLQDDEKPILSLLLDAWLNTQINQQSFSQYIPTTKPNSDKSACNNPLSPDEYVITYFASFVLQYPCTGRSWGHISTDKTKQGQFEKNFTLYLTIVLSEFKNNIWGDGVIKNRARKAQGEIIQSFKIQLQSNGQSATPGAIRDLHRYTYIKSDPINGFEIYHDHLSERHVTAFLTHHIDTAGYPAMIYCLLDPGDTVDDVFTGMYNLSYKYAECSAHWMLNDEIGVSVKEFKAQYAKNFQRFIPTIQAGLADIIIEQAHAAQ